MKMGSEPLDSRERCLLPRTQVGAPPRAQMKDCCSLFIWLTFSLNFNPLTYTFLPLMKRVSLKWNLRCSVRVHNSPSSYITSHLNNVPIKIQSLCLLIGSGRWQAAQTPAFPVSYSGESIPGQALGLSGKSVYLGGSLIGSLDWGDLGCRFGDSLAAAKWFHLGTVLLQLSVLPVILTFDWISALSGSGYNLGSQFRPSRIKVASGLQSFVW